MIYFINQENHIIKINDIDKLFEQNSQAWKQDVVGTIISTDEYSIALDYVQASHNFKYFQFVKFQTEIYSTQFNEMLDYLVPPSVVVIDSQCKVVYQDVFDAQLVFEAIT